MNRAQMNTYQLPIFQASTTNAATATGTIDRLGHDYVSIAVLLPTSNDVTNNPSVLKISESDTTDATNFSDVTAFVGDTAFTIPNSITAATSILLPFAILNVDCRARKRYLKLSVSPVTTQVITAIAVLSRSKTMPDSATEAGAGVVVNG